MAYTTIDDPGEYFNTKLYTGNGSAGHAITGVGFQPDWIWIKDRGATNWHSVRDSVRGTSKQLFTNETNAEETAAYVTAFGSNGFTLGTNNTDVNASNHTYASWNWKAGTSFSNSAGANGANLASTGSVSTTAGFSIVSFTGNRDETRTVFHKLNAVPKMIIFKNRASTNGWTIYNETIGNAKKLTLNNTSAAGNCTACFASTTPTSAVFTVGDDGDTNGGSEAMIAYCFAEKKGYSKFGSYKGNGNADGTFIYTGFKPAFVLIKITDNGSQDWFILDSKRSPFNLVDKSLAPNQADEEYTSEANLDFTAQGFKLRMTSIRVNGSGNNYIYMAFAENPFVTSTGVPATAR